MQIARLVILLSFVAIAFRWNWETACIATLCGFSTHILGSWIAANRDGEE